MFIVDNYYVNQLNENANRNVSLYHISKFDISNNILIPRIPDNYFTRNGFENNTVKRISASTTINGCIAGLSMNCKNMEFFVYKLVPLPYNNNSLKIKVPTTKDVPDCKLTNEIWILNDAKCELVGKIKVLDSINKPYKFKYGNNEAELYYWNYKWLYRLDKENERNDRNNDYN